MCSFSFPSHRIKASHLPPDAFDKLSDSPNSSMKARLVLLLQWFALLSAVLAQDAFLYTFDTPPRPKSSDSTIISSSTGLSILSRRRNSCSDEYIGGFDQEVLELVDSFSGYQQPIFGQASSAPVMKLFLKIEGYDGGAYLIDRRMCAANALTDHVHQNDLPAANLTISRPTRDYLLSIGPRAGEHCAYGHNKMGDYSIYLDGTINKGYTVFEEVCF